MSGERGFTIIEVLFAIMVLTVGVLGLATTGALVTRMVTQGQVVTQASTLASEQFEILRATACTDFPLSGSRTHEGYHIAWAVQAGTGPRAWDIEVRVTSPTGRGTRTSGFETTRFC